MITNYNYVKYLGQGLYGKYPPQGLYGKYPISGKDALFHFKVLAMQSDTLIPVSFPLYKIACKVFF